MMPSGLEEFKPIDRWTLFKRAISHVTLLGDFAEFGVARGKSAEHILRLMPKDRKLFLFDSYEGLPEHWDWDRAAGLRKGHFACKQPDLDDPRCIYVTGLFENTVAAWAKEQDPLAFVHIDSDLYSSCKTVLDGIQHLIVPGTVIQFDEIQGYPSWEQDEWKAWCEAEFCYKWIGRSVQFRAALVVTQ